MKFKTISIVLTCIISSLVCAHAHAVGICPEDQNPLIAADNTSTCIPDAESTTSLEGAHSISQAIPPKLAEPPLESADNSSPIDSSDTPSQPAPSPNLHILSSPTDATTYHDAATDTPNARPILSEIDFEDMVSNDLRENTKGMSGMTIATGLGYSAPTAINIRLVIGYQFGFNYEHASLGLYLDTDFRTGNPLLGADFLLEPKAHFIFNRFQLSLGIGFGLIVFLDSGDDKFFDRTANYEIEKEYNNDLKKNNGKLTYTMAAIKPALEFEWYLNQNTWLGFGLALPVIIEVEDYNWLNTVVLKLFDIYLSCGYKF